MVLGRMRVIQSLSEHHENEILSDWYKKASQNKSNSAKRLRNIRWARASWKKSEPVSDRLFLGRVLKRKCARSTRFPSKNHSDSWPSTSKTKGVPLYESCKILGFWRILTIWNYEQKHFEAVGCYALGLQPFRISFFQLLGFSRREKGRVE